MDLALIEYFECSLSRSDDTFSSAASAEGNVRVGLCGSVANYISVANNFCVCLPEIVFLHERAVNRNDIIDIDRNCGFTSLIEDLSATLYQILQLI